MVRIGDEKYAILGSIKEIESVKPGDIRLVRNQEVILLRDMLIPIVRLDRILSVPGTLPDDQKEHLCYNKKGEKLSAFIVDTLIGQQDSDKVTRKASVRSEDIAGATILEMEMLL